MKAFGCMAVLLALLTACTGGGGGHKPATSSAATSNTATAAAVLPPAQATAIGAALTDGSPARVEVVLEPTVRAAFAKSPSQLVPAGSTVKVVASSFKTQGQEATVSAVVTTAGKPVTWTLLISLVSGQWLVYGTKQ